MKAIILLILLTACNATGAKYTDQMEGNLIIYRVPKAFLDPAAIYPIDINGIPACRLGTSGYFITSIKGRAVITASIWDEPGTSRIEVTPGKRLFLRIDGKQSRALAGIFGGLAGRITQEQVEGGGPFSFVVMQEAIAKQELKGLSRDCD